MAEAIKQIVSPCGWLDFNGGIYMAQKRENNDIVLDFRNKDFSIMQNMKMYILH